MADGSPLGYGEAPTPAARLVIVLLPVGNDQAADAIPGDAPIIVTWPQLGIPSGSREATVADPEFATCYQAEMPALISFLIKCGAEPGDASETAQEAFRRLFDQWRTVAEPKRWLRKEAFPIFLRRPVRNAVPLAENHGRPTPPSGFSWSNFGEEERIFMGMTRLLPTAQRAVLALHIERFQALDTAEILGMEPDKVRENLKEARATLMKSLNLNDNTWTRQGPCAGEPSAKEPSAAEDPAEGPCAEGGAGT